MKALKSGADGILANVGIYMIGATDRDNLRRYVFAMQLSEEPTFTVIAAANGQQVEMEFKHVQSFDLD